MVRSPGRARCSSTNATGGKAEASTARTSIVVAGSGTTVRVETTVTPARAAVPAAIENCEGKRRNLKAAPNANAASR